MTTRWGILWRSDNALDGKRHHLMWNGVQPFLYRTKREAAAAIRERFGYIADRPDLCREPHGWRMPIPVRVRVELITGDRA